MLFILKLVVKLRLLIVVWVICLGVSDLILSTAEFAYINNVNRSTGKSSFQIVNGYSPLTLIDLVPLPPHMRVSEPVENFVKHIHDLHAKIS